jgi:hypothetical protein
VGWVVVVALVPLVGYGLLNLVAPRTTYAWHANATADHTAGNPRRVVGETFQGWLGVTPGAPPDAAILWRIRAIGLGEVVIAVAIALVVLQAF